MTWRNALAFRQVAEQRSFVRAAAAAGVSQPALSKRVAQLERQLKASLLRRTTRRVELTAAGEAVFDAVRDMERLWSTALQTLAAPKTASLPSLPPPTPVAGRTVADTGPVRDHNVYTTRSSPGRGPADRPTMIDLEEACTVLAVAAEGALGPAAERLRTSPRTASHRIYRLEQALGVPLFSKNAGRMALTDAGAVVHATLGQMVDVWERAEAAVSVLAVASSTRQAAMPDAVRVSSYSLAVAALLDHLTARWPEVSWSSVAFHPTQSAHDLHEDKLDLLVGFDIDQSAAAHQHRISLLREPAWLAMHAAHPLADRDPLHLEDLADQPWILQPDGPLRDLVIRACHAAGFRPKVQHTTADVSAIVALISAGRGITFAAPTGRLHEGVSLRPVIGMPTRELYLAWNHRVINTSTARLCAQAILDFYRARAQAGNPSYWTYICDHPAQFPTLSLSHPG